MSKQLVIFKISNEDFGIEITEVREIIIPPEIFKVPNSPEYVEGLINLRGKVHTVFNLRKKFNLDSKNFDENTKIVVANVGSMIAGFIVDEVTEIIKVDDKNIEIAPPSISSFGKKYVNELAKIDDNIILMIDLEKLISEEI